MTHPWTGRTGPRPHTLRSDRRRRTDERHGGDACPFCHQPFRSGLSCLEVFFGFAVDGEAHWLTLLPHDGEAACECCQVAPGGRHHVNCHRAICPRCNGPFVGCDCELDSQLPEASPCQ